MGVKIAQKRIFFRYRKIQLLIKILFSKIKLKKRSFKNLIFLGRAYVPPTALFN